MYPILFSKNETNFTSNGIGRLTDVHSCTIQEVLNGIYELELKIGIGTKYYKDIELLSVIQAYNGTDLQPFDVYKISRPISGIVTVNARHVRYRLNKQVCMPFSVNQSPTACADTLQGLSDHSVEACGFTFQTDVTTGASYEQIIPSTIGERLAGVEGSVLDQFGGQYEFDNFNVYLHKKRGNLYTGITIKYGKNLTDIQQELNIANTVVGIVPYWSDIEGKEVVTLPEKVVYSSRASSFPRKLIKSHDFTQLWQEKPTVAALRSAAQAYVGNSKFAVPSVSINLSFVPLQETEEYKDIRPVEELSLGDTVTVIFEDLGIANEAQVVGYKYDVIREQYISMDIGSLKSNLETTLNDEVAKTIQTVDFATTKVLTEANAAASDAINNATAWLTSANGYVVAVKDEDGSWKELLFMDTNDTSTARNVLRINTNGIGFSTNGISGPYRNAWTIDGNLLAEFITTGILKDQYNKFVLNLDTGELNLTSGTKVDGTALSTTFGKITANETAITSEYNRATAEEGRLNSKITQNADAITSEVSRAQDAETALSSSITQTAQEIESTVAQYTFVWDAENYTISLFGFGTATAAGYKASEYSGQYYLDQRNGNLYRSNGSSWVFVKTLTKVDASLQSQITQNATNIISKVSKGDVVSEINQSADTISLTAGRLLITTGNFLLDANGNITASNATLSGKISSSGLTSSDGSGWVRIQGSVIDGGPGSTVGANRSYLNFNNVFDSESRVIQLRGNAAALSVNKLFITSYEGQTNVEVGQSGVFGNIRFVNGICVELTETSGANGTIEYRGGDGSLYDLEIHGGLITRIGTSPVG